MNELRNHSSNEFVDISSEAEREYVFSGDDRIKIKKPLYLSVSKSGGHRILTSGNRCYYIPPKWIAIGWKPKDGAPHFVK